MNPSAVEIQSPAEGADDVGAGVSRSDAGIWRTAGRRMLGEWPAVASGVVIGAIILLAVLAPVISGAVGHDPNEQLIREATDSFGLPEGPSGEFLFGADSLGRDVFVRTLYGARTSLIVATLATLIQIGLALLVGIPAGYFGGRTDAFLSRITDVALALPALLLMLGIVSACSGPRGCAGGLINPGIPLVSVVLGLFGWMVAARIIRAQTLSIREREFIDAARMQGVRHWRILVQDILPNLTVQIVALTTVAFPINVLAEATLSFLGVGVPVTTPSLGQMLDDANQFITTAWWMMLFPGLFLFAITMSFTALGESLRNALDPKGSRSRVAAVKAG